MQAKWSFLNTKNTIIQNSGNNWRSNQYTSQSGEEEEAHFTVGHSIVP